MGLSQSTQNFVGYEIDRIAEDARMEAAHTLLDMSRQGELIAANIMAPPSGPSTPSSSGTHVSGTTAGVSSRHSTPNSRISNYSYLSPVSAAGSPSSRIIVPETPFDEYGRPIYRLGGFQPPALGGVEYDDIMHNQRGF